MAGKSPPPGKHHRGLFRAGVLRGRGRVQNDPRGTNEAGGKNGAVGRTCTGIVTRPDRTVLCLSYNGMECAQLPATAAYWAEWKGTRLTSLSRTLWDDVQNPRLFKGPAGYRPGRCRWIAKQNARLVHSGCWSVKVFPCRSRAIQKPPGVDHLRALRLLQFNDITGKTWKNSASYPQNMEKHCKVLQKHGIYWRSQISSALTALLCRRYTPLTSMSILAAICSHFMLPTYRKYKIS